MDEEYERGSFRLDPHANSFQMTGFRWCDAPMLLVSLVMSVCLLTGVNAVVGFGLSFLNRDTALAIFGVSVGYLVGVWVGARHSNAPGPQQSRDKQPESLDLSARVKAIADDPSRFIEAIKVYREESGAGLAEAKNAVEAYVRRAP